MRMLQFGNDTKSTKIFSYEILFCFTLKYKVNQYCPTYAFAPCTMCLTLARNIFDYDTILTVIHLYSIYIGKTWHLMYVDYEIKHVKHIFIQKFLNVLQMYFTQDTSYNRTNHNSAVVCCIKIDLLSMQPTFIQIDTRLKCNIHPPAAHNTICSTQDRVKNVSLYHNRVTLHLYQALNTFRKHCK